MKESATLDACRILTLAPHLDELVTMSAWIEHFATVHDLSDRSAFQLELILTEAVTNIVEYGQPPVEEVGIEITCERQGDHLLINIVDAGLPFDPTERAPHLAPDSLASASPGGLGIHLIRKYAQEMRYLREAGRNHLFLTLSAVD
jgi:anti-sigma regulatory factor (Ser/Thr protein kinase)